MFEVLSFGFAPMKGSRHKSQKDAVLTAHGAVGDRTLCLVDLEKQKVLRTVANTSLMAVDIDWTQGILKAKIPGFSVIEDCPQTTSSLVCDYWGRNVKLQILQTPVSKTLSNYLGKSVTLALAETGDIIFGSPYSLIGTASLEYLASRLRRPDLVTEHARLRSTFLIKTSEPFEEDSWAGQAIELLAGKTAPTSLNGTKLRIGAGIGRCTVIDANPITGKRDFAFFKALAEFRPRNERGEPLLGVYADLA